MVSGFLKRTRTLEELDEMFEQNRVAVAEAAAVTFRHTVSIGTASIGEAEHVSSARIMADLSVATAKISVDTEIALKLLATNAQAVMLDIRKRIAESTLDREILHAMISEVGRNSCRGISASASQATDKMNQEAQGAIARIKAYGTEAIGAIEQMAQEISLQVRENATVAEAKLETSKSQVRDPAQTVQRADDAAQKVTDTGAHLTKDILDAVERSVREITTMADDATNQILACVTASDAAISVARDKALCHVEEFVDGLFKIRKTES